MKRVQNAKKYLVFVSKELVDYLGLEKSQNILPVWNRYNGNVSSFFLDKINCFNGKVKFSDNKSEYLLKCSYDKKLEAEFFINELIARTSKMLTFDLSFHFSANNIARVVKNEVLSSFAIQKEDEK